MINITNIIAEAAKIVSISWPLKSFVAVNPFWNLKEKNFYEIFAQLSKISGQKLFLPLSMFIEKYNQGFIQDRHLIRSIELLKDSGIDINLDLSSFIIESKRTKNIFINYKTYCEYITEIEKIDVKDFIIEEISKYCSSYFDLGQASLSLKNSTYSLYQQWKELIELDYTMKFLGFDKNIDHKLSIDQNPVKMIEECAIKLGIIDEFNLKLYIIRICQHMLGWCSHINFQLWQNNLELYNSNRNTTITDIIAIFMYYEYTIFSCKKNLQNQWNHFINQQKDIFLEKNIKFDDSFKLASIWQRADELSYQIKLSSQIVEHGFKDIRPNINPDVQMIFCIDIRSEVIRRKIEKNDSHISTYGFAGFFGVSLHCQHDNHAEDTYHCPVLLKAKIKINKKLTKEHELKIHGKKALGSFLNGLKKGLVSSFAYIEFFGMLSVFKILTNSIKNKINYKKLIEAKINKKFYLQNSLLKNEKIEIVNFFLRHLGIREFSTIVIICGHGSLNTNNAFAASLECGACGGNAGDLNAIFLCELLNDIELREELKKAGKFNIPENTIFLPALHETISDEIFFLKFNQSSKKIDALITQLEYRLKAASLAAQQERAKISKNLFLPAMQRSTNWGELRPEWGLARNAAFIIAPRQRTKNINLEGRVFLHDYDYTQDEGMKTLELIMTAPMIVTNWINMQYYASSVCPSIYGSGNKILQNIEGLLGVIEGNSGDLKIGLPMQSVYDGNALIHEPLRLSVFIEAPIIEIEKVIAAHSNIRNLVENQWLYIFALNLNNKNILFRRSKENYEYVR